MPLNKSKIKKILVVSLTNIGDVVLTLPVVDVLREELPDSEISIIIGPKAVTLFHGSKQFKEVIVFDKHKPKLKTAKWIFSELRNNKYDFVVDLKNSAMPFFLGAPYRTSYIDRKKQGEHMKDKHLSRLRNVFAFKKNNCSRNSINVNNELFKSIKDLNIKSDRYIVISPGAADMRKRWSKEGFAMLADHLVETYNVKAVFVGDAGDAEISDGILALMKNSAISLCGNISLSELASVLKHSMLAIVNDSAPMHIASYLNVPVIAFFGPTDPSKYGPWSIESKVFISKNMEKAEPEIDTIIKEIKMLDRRFVFSS